MSLLKLDQPEKEMKEMKKKKRVRETRLKLERREPEKMMLEKQAIRDKRPRNKGVFEEIG